MRARLNYSLAPVLRRPGKADDERNTRVSARAAAVAHHTSRRDDASRQRAMCAFSVRKNPRPSIVNK